MSNASDLELFTSSIERYRVGDFSRVAGTWHEEVANRAIWETKSNAARISTYFVYTAESWSDGVMSDGRATCMPFNHIVVSNPPSGVIIMAVEHVKKKGLVMLEVYLKEGIDNFVSAGIWGAIDVYEGIFDITTAAFSGEEREGLARQFATLFIAFLKDLNASKAGGNGSRMKNNFASKKLQRSDISTDRATISYREIVISSQGESSGQDIADGMPVKGKLGRKSPASHFRRGHIRELKNGKRVMVGAAKVGSNKDGVIVPTYIVGGS